MPHTLFQTDRHFVSALSGIAFSATVRFSTSRRGSGWNVLRSRPLNRTPFILPQFGDQITPSPTGVDDSLSTACFMSVVLFDADQSARARLSDFAATRNAIKLAH